MDTANLKHAGFLDGLLTALESYKPGKDASHYGKKGMRWGVTTLPDGTQTGNPRAAVQVKQKPGKAVKTSGGRERSASEDAIAAKVGKQIARKSSTDALSNAELQAVVTRMQLEQNFTRLATPQKSAGRKFIENMLFNKQQRDNMLTNGNDIRERAAAKSLSDALKAPEPKKKQKAQT